MRELLVGEAEGLPDNEAWLVYDSCGAPEICLPYHPTLTMWGRLQERIQGANKQLVLKKVSVECALANFNDDDTAMTRNDLFFLCEALTKL